ncbi:MAG: histidine phosphatase family protein [Clostridia bacterium]|nr:histidine phosphatase family protein [Clostridia bacterium]
MQSEEFLLQESLYRPGEDVYRMRIIFVRHGEPNYEKDCLTEAGHLQASAVAERLREEEISAVWSSPLGRARETADVTASLLNLPVQTLDFMRELHWGSRDGTPLFANGHPWDLADEIARRGISLNRSDWRESVYFRNNRVCESVDLVESGIDSWLLALGYQREEFYYRCTQADDAQATVALFSHGGSSSAAIAHMLNLPFPFVCALLHMEFTGITIIRLGRKPGSASLPCLELANDGRHIHGIKYHRLAMM